MSKELSISKQHIENRIYRIRDEQVMLDSDLADMYQVETKYINRAVKRNEERFPNSFMFQLNDEEWENLKFQFGTSNEHGGRRTLPFVFTEQGVAMLSAVLRTDIAVKVSIQIIEAFVQMRKLIGQETIQHLRLSSIENKLVEHDQKFYELFSALENNALPQRGVYFDGQVYDAYQFVSEIIKKAKSSIVLIDNYIDDTVLTLLSKRESNVKVNIYTATISKQLRLDLQRHNQQYPNVSVELFKQSHDRFLIIDHKELYHIGASLKENWNFIPLDKLDLSFFNLLEYWVESALEQFDPTTAEEIKPYLNGAIYGGNPLLYQFMRQINLDFFLLGGGRRAFKKLPSLLETSSYFTPEYNALQSFLEKEAANLNIKPEHYDFDEDNKIYEIKW